MARVLRILSAAAFLAVVAAGCGGAAPQKLALHGIPRALAQDWEQRASAIASAAAAGHSCNALRLADALRSDVVATQHKVPLRLRAPLLNGVKALANRITCVPTVQTQPKKPPKAPRPPHEHHGKDGRHGHGDSGGRDK